MAESGLSDVQQALRALGTKRLILAIHDQSFPSKPDEEIGRGSPYSQGGLRFIEFCAGLGFNTIQFGPQGKTTPFNPSPYDGTIFSRNDFSIALKELTSNEWNGLLGKAALSVSVSGCPASAPGHEGTSDYKYACKAQHDLLRRVFLRFKAGDKQSNLSTEFSKWVEAQRSVADDWLERDALFEVLSLEYGSDDWRSWNELDRSLFVQEPATESSRAKRIDELKEKHSDDIQFYRFCQFVADRQHDRFRKFTTRLGLKIFGDLQIGYSPRDTWSRAGLFLSEYLMGAPPSRTNPEGQPWGYPVLDPFQYFAHGISQIAHRRNGKALDLMSDRAVKMLTHYDGLRIDHPHGFVCPWVYRASDPDPLQAVKDGARLFSTPECAEHSDLADLAIVSSNQITSDPKVPRYADGWVTELSDAQVEQYSVLIDCIIAAQENLASDFGVKKSGGDEPHDIVCEVLSTCPYPLRRVLERHHLGRFRVTQKADLSNPQDLYRSENARPEDLIMVANHDTKPIWLLVDEWFESGQHTERAAYLAERLDPNVNERARFAAELVASKQTFTHAMFADLFASPAESVSVFFADLLGSKEIYNRPGTISDANWSLRVPRDYESRYERDTATGDALNLPRALSMALRARYPNPEEAIASLISRLDAPSKSVHNV